MAGNSKIRCEGCGQFISIKDLEDKTKTDFVFIPDTQVTMEVSYWIHTACKV